MLAGSPDVGRDRSGQQNAANQHDPGAHIAGSDRAAGDRDGNHRPGGIAHGERTRPVQTAGKRTLRVRADRNHLRARAVEVKRAGGGYRRRGGRKEVEIETRHVGGGVDDALEQDADLEEGVNKPDQMLPALRHRRMRRTPAVYRSDHQKADTVPPQRKMRTGGRPILVASGLKRPLPQAAIIEIQTVDGRIKRPRLRRRRSGNARLDPERARGCRPAGWI